MLISLAAPLMSRDGFLGKDPGMTNCYLEERLDGGHTVVRRPALGPAIGGIPAGTVQGTFVQGTAAWAVINDVAYTVPPGGSNAAVGLPGVNNPGLRIEAATVTNADSTVPTFVKSVERGWLFSNGAFSQIASAYPPTTVPGTVYLDGTYYVMTPAGSINGSALNDCTSWNGLNFVSTDRGLGAAVALHRHLNYVVAFCEKGTQFFYDAANPGPGSPLGVVPNVTSSYGCAHPYSIQSMDDTLIFLARDAKRGRSFCMMRGLSVQKISTPDIDRILERNQFDSFTAARWLKGSVGPGGGWQQSESGYQQLYCNMVKADGHLFYIFSMMDKGLTLVYDVANQHWSRWSTCTDGVTHQAFSLAATFPCYDTTANAAAYGIPVGGGSCAAIGAGDQAGGESVLMEIRTRELNHGTTTRKVCSELSLLGDTVAATMNLRYSNDSGQTWSAFRAINLGLTRKRLTRLGTFISRIYNFSCYTTAKVRLESMVLPDRNLPAQSQPSGE